MDISGWARGRVGLKNRAVDPEHGTGADRSSHSHTKGNDPK
jgi:hypothetical protein